MSVLLVGVIAAAWAGSVAGHFAWYAWVILATACGYAFGRLSALGYGAWWMGLQWMIALLVYGSHFAGPVEALRNAMAICAGGASQIIFLMLTGLFTDRWFSYQDQPPLEPMDSIAAALFRDLNPASAAGEFASARRRRHLRRHANLSSMEFAERILDPDDRSDLAAAGFPGSHDSRRQPRRGYGGGGGSDDPGSGPCPPRAARAGRFIDPIDLGLPDFHARQLRAIRRLRDFLCGNPFFRDGPPSAIVALHRVLATLVGAILALLVSLVPIPWARPHR